MPISYGVYATPRADLGEAILEYEARDSGFIADQVLPTRDVPRKAATMSVKTRENLKRVDTTHANGSVFNRTNMELEDLEYICKDYGLEEVLTDDDRENYADDFDAQLELTEDITQDIKREFEIRTKELVFNTTTFAGGDLFKDNSGSPWDTISTDIHSQIEFALDKIRINGGGKANSLIIGEGALNDLMKNTKVISNFPGAPKITQSMIRDTLPDLFGLQKLIVGSEVYDSADEGQDFDGADIWPDTFAMVARISDGGSLRRGGLGRTFRWAKMKDKFDRVIQYREEQSEGDIFRVRQYQIEKMIDIFAGFLMEINT